MKRPALRVVPVPTSGDGVKPVSTADFDRFFLERYTPMIRLSYTLTSSQEDAEEVVMDAFADLYDRWDRVLNPAGYLRTSVVNGSRRRLRRRIQRIDVHRRATTPRAINIADSTEYLEDVIDRLPERQRTALILAYYADMTSNEIAETLGCRPGTAKSLVHRGLRKIEKELER